MNVYMSIGMYMYTCIYACIYTQVCDVAVLRFIHALGMCILTFYSSRNGVVECIHELYICMYMYKWMHVNISMCMYIYLFACMCIYIYIYTYTCICDTYMHVYVVISRHG